MKRKKGFTLIELLAVIVTPIILNVIEDARVGAFKNSAGYLMKAAENKYLTNQLNGTEEDLVYEYVNGVAKNGKDLEYKGETPKNGTIVVRKDGKISIAIDNGKWCAIKSYDEDNIKLVKLTEDNCKLNDVPEIPKEPFDEAKGANRPQLTAGMTPIKWNEMTEVITNENDPEWYDYKEKKWANAKTADGSYWVWIPRYAYKIVSGYHTSTAGNVDIKFLRGYTNETTDGTPVETSGYEAGVKDTSKYYFLHPAFTFGSDETPGFWVAKFEPSGAASNIKVLPNVSSLRGLSINDQFNAAYNMRSNSMYGWNENEVETYMMKNTEWGAVAYLSKSLYGANAKIIFNNSSTYTTGCAGNGGVDHYSGCLNAYNTVGGVKASTTYNITGVYDMSGGTNEYVAAYVNNGNSNLTTFGSSVVNADNKYKDVYIVGGDTRSGNYNANKNKYGDAIYETTANVNYINISWHGENTYMPYSSFPWILRGGFYGTGTNGGLFCIQGNDYGELVNYQTFRPVVRLFELSSI